MRRSGHRDRTDISGSKVRRAAITPARKCTDGIEPSRTVLQTILTTRSCAQNGQCSDRTNSCGFSDRRFYEVSLLSGSPQRGPRGPVDLGSGPTGAERRPRTRISTLRGWPPIQLVDGAIIAPTGLEPDISALKGCGVPVAHPAKQEQRPSR